MKISAKYKVSLFLLTLMVFTLSGCDQYPNNELVESKLQALKNEAIKNTLTDLCREKLPDQAQQKCDGISLEQLESLTPSLSPEQLAALETAAENSLSNQVNSEKLVEFPSAFREKLNQFLGQKVGE